MVGENKQQLSEYIDDLALSDDMLKQLAESGELKQTFTHYQLIGQAMRDELPPQIDLDFSAKIAAAIELEPTIIAPKVSQVDNAVSAPKQAKIIPFISKFSQYGIAASVAAALVIGVQQLNIADSSIAASPVLQTVPMGGFVSPVSLQANTQSAVQQRNEQQQRIERRRQVNAYIQDHVLQQRIKSEVVDK